jgi:glycosyltransferase involved in cell wall biosynthesis
MLQPISRCRQGCADLRLAVVSPFVDRQHGTERALAELLERLAYKYGCEIHLYTQRVEDLELRAMQKAPGNSSGAIVWHRVPRISGPHLLQFLVWVFLNEFQRRWDTTFHKMSFDLVLSPGINGIQADVVIVHVLFCRLQELSRAEQGNASASKPGLLRRVHRNLYYKLLGHMERRAYSNPKVSIVAVSNRIAGILNEHFGRHYVHVIPNGVDTLQFSPQKRLERKAKSRKLRGYSDNDFVILLIGNDWQTKGLESVLSAMTAYQHLPTKLLVVGSDDVGPFRARAEQLGILERCRWEVSAADVLDFYSAADVYASPSREDSFGLPVIEAMACGLPAITSICAGASEHVSDGIDGFVLQDPNDAESLGRILDLLCNQPETRSRIGLAAANTAQQLSWDRNAAGIWKILSNEFGVAAPSNSTEPPSSGIMS